MVAKFYPFIRKIAERRKERAKKVAIVEEEVEEPTGDMTFWQRYEHAAKKVAKRRKRRAEQRNQFMAENPVLGTFIANLVQPWDKVPQGSQKVDDDKESNKQTVQVKQRGQQQIL